MKPVSILVVLSMSLFIVLCTGMIAPTSAGGISSPGTGDPPLGFALATQKSTPEAKSTATQTKPQSGTPTTPGNAITSGKTASGNQPQKPNLAFQTPFLPTAETELLIRENDILGDLYRFN